MSEPERDKRDIDARLQKMHCRRVSPMPDPVWPENSIRRIPRPTKGYNQGLHLRPKLRDLRVGECPGNPTDQTGDAKIVDTAHTSGAPAVHD